MRLEVVGEVAELWRYPIKSMGGEQLQQTFVGPLGVHGDRMLAFESSAAAVGKPLVSGAERTAMLLCGACFAHSLENFEGTVDPAHVEVRTRDGGLYRADEPQLIRALQAGIPDAKPMWLRVCERPAMDCRPVGLLSLGTLRQLSHEWGAPVLANRFRANLILDLRRLKGFGEDAFVGRTLLIGEHTQLAITERDPRCRVVTLDPRTGQRDPALMTHLARKHEGKVGVYATVITPGVVSAGDAITLL